MQQNLEITHSGTSKVQHYKWVIKDSPGEFKRLDKATLNIDHTYQREVKNAKILELARSWSWVACGVIIVADRGDSYWVIDGQHRVIAARHRSDIQKLPCLVFDAESIADEAKGFLNVNTNRRPMTGLDRFNAQKTAGDPVALFVQKVFDQYGIEASSRSEGARRINCISVVMKHAAADAENFKVVMHVLAQVCHSSVLYERLVQGMFYLHTHIDNGFHNQRLLDRTLKVGADSLMEGANKAASLFANGGAKVWAEGMLIVLNKGLQHRFKFKNTSEDEE